MRGTAAPWIRHRGRPPCHCQGGGGALGWRTPPRSCRRGGGDHHAAGSAPPPMDPPRGGRSSMDPPRVALSRSHGGRGSKEEGRGRKGRKEGEGGGAACRRVLLPADVARVENATTQLDLRRSSMDPPRGTPELHESTMGKAATERSRPRPQLAGSDGGSRGSQQGEGVKPERGREGGAPSRRRAWRARRGGAASYDVRRRARGERKKK
jgi:hypothetical protein